MLGGCSIKRGPPKALFATPGKNVRWSSRNLSNMAQSQITLLVQDLFGREHSEACEPDRPDTATNGESRYRTVDLMNQGQEDGHQPPIKRQIRGARRPRKLECPEGDCTGEFDTPQKLVRHRFTRMAPSFHAQLTRLNTHKFEQITIGIEPVAIASIHLLKRAHSYNMYVVRSNQSKNRYTTEKSRSRKFSV